MASGIGFELHFKGSPRFGYSEKIFRLQLTFTEEGPNDTSTDYRIYGIVNPQEKDQQVTIFEWAKVEHRTFGGVDKSSTTFSTQTARQIMIPSGALGNLDISVHITNIQSFDESVPSDVYDEIKVEVDPFSGFKVGQNYCLHIIPQMGPLLKGRWQTVSLPEPDRLQGIRGAPTTSPIDRSGSLTPTNDDLTGRSGSATPSPVHFADESTKPT